MYPNREKKIFDLSKTAKLLITFTGILIGFLLARIFLMTPYIIQDNSMAPNFRKGDYVIILKFISPEPGDAVLVNSPLEHGKVIFKRLLTKGEKRLEINNKNILINKNKTVLSWKTQSNDQRIFPASFSNRDNLPETTIKEGEIFLLGDNLDFSFDSREFGPVKEDEIIGKMIYKF